MDLKRHIFVSLIGQVFRKREITRLVQVLFEPFVQVDRLPNVKIAASIAMGTLGPNVPSQRCGRSAPDEDGVACAGQKPLCEQDRCRDPSQVQSFWNQTELAVSGQP